MKYWLASKASKKTKNLKLTQIHLQNYPLGKNHSTTKSFSCKEKSYMVERSCNYLATYKIQTPPNCLLVLVENIESFYKEYEVINEPSKVWPTSQTSYIISLGTLCVYPHAWASTQVSWLCLSFYFLLHYYLQDYSHTKLAK